MVVQDKLSPLGGQLSTFVHAYSSYVDSNMSVFHTGFTFLQILVHKKLHSLWEAPIRILFAVSG